MWFQTTGLATVQTVFRGGRTATRMGTGITLTASEARIRGHIALVAVGRPSARSTDFGPI